MKINNVSVIVPTLNSEKYIRRLIEILLINFSDIIIGVDTKSSDDTLKIVKEYPVKLIHIDNKSGYAENGVIKILAEQCSNKWILRLDDDELISNQLIEFIGNSLKTLNVSCVGFHRKWCRINQSQLEWMALPDYSYDWQWRLFKKDQVNFINDIHTPGYFFDTSKCAPIEACIFHLDWIYHTYQERKEKINRYESIKLGGGESVRHYYLYEDIENFSYYFIPVWESSIPNILKTFIKTNANYKVGVFQPMNVHEYIFTSYNTKSCRKIIIKKLISLKNYFGIFKNAKF